MTAVCSPGKGNDPGESRSGDRTARFVQAPKTTLICFDSPKIPPDLV